MSRCFVTRELPGDAVARLGEGHEVTVWKGDGPPSPAELRAALAEAEGLLCNLTDRIDEELLAAAPRLRVIANYAVGSDNIDLEAARARGIPVGVTPDVLTDATAEIAIALMLSVARRLPEAAAAVREGGWKRWEPSGWLGVQLSGSSLAVVGGGRIGRATGDRAAGLGMEVSYVGRADDLHAALAAADFVSLHVPYSEATHHLIDAAALAAIKPGAILVNTARGKIVDQEALRAALLDGRLGGAGLDVTDPEPLPADDPLLEAPNLLVLPHIGSATGRARSEMAELAVANLLAGLAGEELPKPAG
jgi:glyoxylate reductase